MPGLTRKDRLLPSLLDRLHGDEDDVTLYSEQRLRQNVKRDLTWLLNTTHLEAVEDLSKHPEVARSVLNFGVPGLAGLTSTSIRSSELEDAFRQAILNFEPRLMRSSVRVTLEKHDEQMNQNALVFTIAADLWAEPLPLQILLRTHVDLENGRVELEDAVGRGEAG